MAHLNVSRKSGFILRNGAKRRDTVWIGIGEASTTLPATGSTALTNVFGVLTLLSPFTIVRTYVDWFLKSDQTGALELFQAAFGIAVVSDQSAAIGISAIPTPFTDLDSDLWLMHEIMAGGFTFVSGTGFNPVGGVHRSLDSKAMRKVEDGQDVAFTLENSGVGLGTTSLTAGRMLLKLH